MSGITNKNAQMEDVYKVEKIPNENRYGVYVTHPDYADNFGGTTMLVAMRSTKEEADEYAKNREYDKMKMAKGGTMKPSYKIWDSSGQDERTFDDYTEMYKYLHSMGDDMMDYEVMENTGKKREVIKRFGEKFSKGGTTQKFYRGGRNRYDRGERPSPRESATLFMPGYRRVGQDGNMWFIVENSNGVKRWQRERRYAEGGIVEMGKIIKTKENNIVIEAKVNGEFVPLNFKEEELIDEDEDGEYIYSYVAEHNGKWYMVDASFTGNPNTDLNYNSILGDIEEIENPQIAKDKRIKEQKESYARQKAEWDKQDAERIAKEKSEGTYDNYVIDETIDRYEDQSGEWHDIEKINLIVPYTWQRHNSREVYDSMIVNEFNKLGYNAKDYRPHWTGDARPNKGEYIVYYVGYTFMMSGEAFPEYETDWFDELQEAIDFAKKKGSEYVFYKKYFDGKLAEKGKIEAKTSKYIPELAEGGELSSPFSIGDIVHGKGHHGEVFYTIITEREIGSGHYAFKSDAVGNPITGSYANTQFIHSFSFKDWHKVGHKELDKVTKHGLTYYKSGDEGTDVYLALLDGVRNKYFWENAPKNLKSKFDRLENDNYHFTSAELVNDFFNHPTWKHIKKHRLAAEEGMLLSKSEYARGGRTYSQGGVIGFLNTKLSFRQLFD